MYIRSSQLLAFLWILLLSVPVCLANPKKVIYYGWGARDSNYIRQHWHEMDQLPFDGIGIMLSVDPNRAIPEGDTAHALGWNMLTPIKLERSKFEPIVSDLKSAKWVRFTDNFLVSILISGDPQHSFDWFDQGRFDYLRNHWELLLSIAKDSGLKGILLDPEQYGNPIFDYRELKKRLDRPFEEYRAKILARGVELMQFARANFPELVILSMGAHTSAWNGVRDRFNLHQVKPLAEAEYGLLPAFLDGMLAGASHSTSITDGYEISYGFKDAGQFIQARSDILNKAISLSQVQDLYTKQLKVGFGLWLDYGGPAAWDSLNFERNYFTPTSFHHALNAALKQSDEYVWIYSQKAKPFPIQYLPKEYLEAIETARRINIASDITP